ncbi:MAG TPA: hypothetical protein VJB68_00105 [Methylophilaceae bacterium]|nr:hypothetical protein [Methylophilaceae bacterium]
MNKYSLVLLVSTALLLDACALFPKATDTSGNVPVRVIDNAPISNQTLLEYAGSFVELSADAQKKELIQINQAISQNKNDLKNRMKAAMVYALPNSRLRDTAKAQNLLDDLLREKTLDNERKALATLLRDYIIEINKLTQKARDEQKRADALQQKNEALQQMLDDLKNIEKTMIDRDQGIRK